MSDLADLTELAALGEAMLTRTGAGIATELLKPDHFTDPVRAEIFAAIACLHTQGAPCDPVTVAGYLHDHGGVAVGTCELLHEAITLAAVNPTGDAIADVAVAAFGRQLGTET